MNTVLYLAITLLALNIAYLIFRVWESKDWSILGSLLPRAYLIFLVCTVIFGNRNELIILHLGVLLVFLSDLIVNVIRFLSRKYTKKISYHMAAVTLKELQDKQSFIINNSLFGMFTCNLNGELEFGNEKFMNDTFLTVGDNLTIYFPELRELQYGKEIVKFITSLRSGTKIEMCAGRTRNGHDTITGIIREI